jgi:hypothetical protein
MVAGGINSNPLKYGVRHRRKYGTSAGTIGQLAQNAVKNCLYNIEGASEVFNERFSGTSLYVQPYPYIDDVAVGGYGYASLFGPILGSSWTEAQQNALYSAYADNAGWMYVTYYDAAQSKYADGIPFTTISDVNTYLNGNTGYLVQAPNYCNLNL